MYNSRMRRTGSVGAADETIAAARFVWRMRPYFRQVAGEMVLGSLCGFVMNTAVVLPALLLGRAIDQVVALSRGQTDPAAVTIAALLFVAGTLATEVPRIGKRWWLITANNRIRANIRADVFRGVVAWPMARLQRTPIGDLMARTVGDVEVLGVGVREFTIEIWDTVLFCISIVVAMLLFDPLLTVLALLPVPLALLVAHAVGRWVTERTTSARQVNARLTGAIQEYLSGLRVLRLFGRRAAAVDQVADLSGQQARANLALLRVRTGLQPAYSTLMTAGIIAVVWLGGQRVLAGAMTIGAFAAYVELFGRFVGRGYRIPQLVNSIQSGATAYARLEPLLAAPLPVEHEPAFASFVAGRLAGLDHDPPPPSRVRSGPAYVQLRNATFSYPGAAEPAFRGLNLDIPAGSFVAVTGPIGSGKSALARCLAGLYPLSAGDVLIDGTRACEVPSGVVGYAPQESQLFTGSVRENVFLGSDPPGVDRLDLLVRLAAFEQDVAAMPAGYQTPIGELGIRLSGGQRQRLGLARAMAAYPPAAPGVLVLDDPFSAVDVDTEMRILANLRCAFGPDALVQNRSTVVLFSQRLAAFSQADLVVVLDRGRIVECGAHAVLLAQEGLYARIYRAQMRVESPVSAGARSR
jgi:ATP-binding cassette, subfamily B, multidrug efflux pump